MNNGSLKDRQSMKPLISHSTVQLKETSAILAFSFLLLGALFLQPSEALATKEQWERVKANKDTKELFHLMEDKYETGSHSTDEAIEERFHEDMKKLDQDPIYHCANRYRYKLYDRAGILSNEQKSRATETPCSDARMIPVVSTDTSVIGRPFFLADLDPRKIQRIQVGRNKTNPMLPGHSFLKIDVCPTIDKDGKCEKPLEIVIHPGGNEEGNVQLGARTYSDMLAATQSRKVDIELIDEELPSDESKANYIDGLLEVMNNGQGSKYGLLNNNCATNVNKIRQLASFTPDRSIIKTIRPGAVMSTIETQTKTKRTKVIPYKEKGEIALKRLLKENKINKTNFAAYAKLDADKRYCNPKNKNGLMKEVNKSDNAQEVVEMLQGIGSQESNTEKLKTICDQASQNFSEFANLVTTCAELEDAVASDRKAELYKLKKKDKVVVSSASPAEQYAQQATNLERLRQKLWDTVVKVDKLVMEIATKENGGVVPYLTEQHYTQRLDAFGKDDPTGQALTKEMSNLQTKINKANAEVLASYAQIRKKVTGSDTASKLKDILKEKGEKNPLLAHCAQSAVCPMETGNSP